MAGKTVLEDGCGTAYISAYIARAGGTPVGLDNSQAQLATARRMQLKHHLRFPLIHGIAEQLPFRDDSLDLVISEYGAAIWSDPYLWIPEAARVLKPGGELTFLGNSALFMLFAADDEDEPAGTTMIRDHFGMHRFEWPDGEEVEFHIGHGERIRLLRDCGLEVLDLIELRAPEGAVSNYPYIPYDWSRRWPSEEVWRARKR